MGLKVVVEDKSDQNQKVIFLVQKKVIKPVQILKDENGAMHIIKDGLQIEVKMTGDGKPFFFDKFGQVQYVNSSDQPVIQNDSSGKPFIIENGIKRNIRINENG